MVITTQFNTGDKVKFRCIEQREIFYIGNILGIEIEVAMTKPNINYIIRSDKGTYYINERDIWKC